MQSIQSADRHICVRVDRDLGHFFQFADDRYSNNNTSAWWLLVCGPGKQQQIPIRIFDYEILGAPRLLFQCLLKGNSSGLEFKKQQLDLLRCGDGHRCRQ
jgi:hypothetical protein